MIFFDISGIFSTLGYLFVTGAEKTKIFSKMLLRSIGKILPSSLTKIHAQRSLLIPQRFSSAIATIQKTPYMRILIDGKQTSKDSTTTEDSKKSSLIRFVQAWVKDFQSAKAVGLVQLDASVFAAPIRVDIMHRVVVYIRSQKRGIVKRNLKNRSEVRGSNRKMRRQKGFGRARVGDRKSPLFRGGGRAFPVKTRDFRLKLNKKIQDYGMRSALSSKYAQVQLCLINDFPSPIDGDLKTAAKNHQWLHDGSKTLLVTPDEESAQILSEAATTLKRLRVIPMQQLDVYEILNNDYLVISRSVLNGLEQRYHTF